MLLETAGLDKKFNGVYALKGLDFSLQEGEIHGLVGENGAGKSTFIKLLGGVYRKDGGTLSWLGRELSGMDSGEFGPKESRALGINIIFQDNVLIPAFTGYENICLGRPYPVRGGLIRWRDMERRAAEKAEELGIQMNLRQPVSGMTPAQKKCVEIIRAMMEECRLLVLDEPTAALSDQETRRLFQIIRRLREKGTAVLYVSHRLEEILELTDRVTVLRNGELAAVRRTSETSQEELVGLMSGEKVPWNPGVEMVDGAEQSKAVREKSMDAAGAEAADEMGQSGAVRETVPGNPGISPALEARDLYSADGIVRGASLRVENSRITGLFGLCGSGRTEFLECIYGYRRVKSGEVLTDGVRLERLEPPEAIKRGMAFICEDRRGKAMIPAFTVEENMLLSSIDRYSSKGRFLKRRAAEQAREMVRALNIRCTGLSQPARELSGGNQQKVVFAKALLTEPSIWLCDEPTQAVDVATRKEIHRLLRREAEKGHGILYVSSDLTELLEVADEVAVMVRGRIQRVFRNEGLRPEQVLRCCYGTEEPGMEESGARPDRAGVEEGAPGHAGPATDETEAGRTDAGSREGKSREGTSTEGKHTEENAEGKRKEENAEGKRTEENAEGKKTGRKRTETQEAGRP